MRHLRWIVMVIVLLGGVTAGSAQDEAPSPILSILASTPDTPEARAYFSYLDYEAVARGAFDLDTFVRALVGVSSGPDLSNFLRQAESQQQLIGVSVFEMLQGAQWGEPPALATVLQGEFDLAAIEAAYAARDYTTDQAAGLTVFCGPSGCAAGDRLSLENREPGDPFGGHLGRQQPVLLVPLTDEGYQLLSTTSLELVTASAEAATGDAPSLADDPAWQAAVRAVTADGVLRQAWFTTADMVTPQADPVTALSPYELLLMAETGTADGEIASATLVFPTLAEAEAGADSLEQRIEAYQSLVFRAPLLDHLSERGYRYAVSAFEDAETGLGLAQVVIRGDPDQISFYRELVRGLLSRDLGWLGVN